MNYIANVTLAVLSTALCLTIATIFFALISYVISRLERHREDNMKLAQLEAIYSRWYHDMDYTTLQAINDIGDVLKKEEGE